MTGADRDTPLGGRNVGALAEAEPAPRLFIWALRRWLDGVAGQQTVWNHLGARLGSKDAHRAMGLLERHIAAVADGSRRSLRRRPACCPLISADEARLARTVASAAAGDLDDAYAAAAGYARGDALFEIVETAAQFGRFLARLGDIPSDAAQTAPHPGRGAQRPPTLH